jgi:hypothetical protein
VRLSYSLCGFGFAKVTLRQISTLDLKQRLGIGIL